MSRGTIPPSIACPARNGGASAAAVAITSVITIRITCVRYGRSRPSSQRSFRARSSSPRTIRHRSRNMSSVPASRPGWFAWSSVSTATSESWVSGSRSVTASVSRRRVVSGERELKAAPPPRAPPSRAAGRPRPRTRTRRSPRRAASAASSSSCVPRSAIRPSSMTTISSASEIVDSRWATTNVVLPCHRLAQPALDLLLGARIDRRGRVVEDQHPRVRDQRPRDRNPLALPARERQPALADHRLVPLRQPG